MGVRHRFSSVLASAVLVAAGCTGISRLSVSSSDAQGNGPSSAPAINNDGRFVAFASSASNFVANDNNGVADIFVRDTLNGVTTRISVATSGTQANGASSRPFISSEGRYVVFTSVASNLAANDIDTTPDVFVRDRTNNTTSLVTTNVVNEATANGVSTDGRFVLFTVSGPNLVSVVYLADRTTGNITQQSNATKCNDISLPGGPNNLDVGGAAIDGDASLVAYWLQCSSGPEVFRVIVRDRTAGTDTDVGGGGGGLVSPRPGHVALSADGSTLFWSFQTTSGRAGDNQTAFVWRAGKGATPLAIPEGGFEPLCVDEQCVALSPDGRYLAFETSSGKDGFQLYVCPCRVALLDLTSGEQFDVSQSTKFAPRDGHEPMFEGDGNRITFSSAADDLVFDDSNGVRDVFNRSVQGVLDPGNPGTFVVSND
jgi:hypothetical protein